uniref:Uncharacterized protein n=1 Tax=Picea glauca TaxID=3330 RepID=A0A101M216_PICGL|nr:hypothetical protein ABT39_MTgene2831 [Picea glauca]
MASNTLGRMGLSLFYTRLPRSRIRWLYYNLRGLISQGGTTGGSTVATQQLLLTK